MSPALLDASVTSAQFASKVAALEDESAVNEFWNSVFKNWFPSTSHEWMIKQDEPNAERTQQVNLLITHNKVDSAGASISNQPYIAYVGKVAGGDQFAQIQKQIRAYFSCDITFPNVRQGANACSYYAVGAQGSQVVFWKYQIKEKGQRSLYGLTYDPSGNFKTTVVTDKTLPTAYDLTVATDVPKIGAFMTHFRLRFH